MKSPDSISVAGKRWAAHHYRRLQGSHVPHRDLSQGTPELRHPLLDVEGVMQDTYFRLPAAHHSPQSTARNYHKDYVP